MTIKPIEFVVATLLMFGQPAFAGFNVNGADLGKWIKADQRVAKGSESTDDMFDGRTLQGYLKATMDGTNQKYCSPKGLNIKLVTRVVDSYLNENPQFLNRSATSLVVAAMHDAFPCDGK